jgi:hypothetical protein
MDVMLVFVCGLLIALIVHWNIDLSSVESPSSPSMQELEGDMQEVPDGIDIEGGDYSQLGTVYRDEATGQIIKRVKEFTSTGNKSLAKEFIEAFEAERKNTDGWEENRNASVVQITAVWRNPKRIYSLATTDATIVVYAQTIYNEATKNDENQ